MAEKRNKRAATLTREELEADTRRFLKKGGQIARIKTGVSGSALSYGQKKAEQIRRNKLRGGRTENGKLKVAPHDKTRHRKITNGKSAGKIAK